MSRFNIIIFFFCSLFGYSQEEKTFETDSSSFYIGVSSTGSKRILETFKNSNHQSYIFINPKGIIKTIGWTDTLSGEWVGVWKEFDANTGDLISIVDYGNAVWRFHDAKHFPYTAILDQVKAKADARIKKHYGESFFKKHAKWNINYSRINGEGNERIIDKWTTANSAKPTLFRLNYNLKIDTAEYVNLIQFYVDADGQFVEKLKMYTKGLQTVSQKKPFVITPAIAIERARVYGLKENDFIGIKTALVWEETTGRDSSKPTGEFFFQVIEKTSEEKIYYTPDRFTIEPRYMVYVFNPWTGEFIGKKKMKPGRSGDKIHPSGSGLIPDE